MIFGPQPSGPIVLTFVRCYLPGYKSGGPVRTIANMVAALGDDLDFRIVTSDRDATDIAPYPHLGAGSRWLDVGRAKVLYLSPSQRKLRNIARIIGETPHDTLYLNSFFDPIFTLKPLLARRLGLAPKKRCVIAPRGEFSPCALELKAAKKRVFLSVSHATGLHRNLIWQASSGHEAEDIRRAMGGNTSDICVAADLPARADGRSVHTHRPREEGEPLRICFLSRISPMKNLDFALKVLRRVKSPVRFDIYGPVRDENYWSRCRALMRQLPTHVEATYRGSVEPDRVPSILAGYDLFFLPTLGENYGHVILEALASGTPVLIADTTPWRNLAKMGLGWDLPLQNPEAFVCTVDHAAQLSSAERTQMRKRALIFAETRRTDLETVSANRNLFAQATPA
jgi:glycosyltransferase involved in cell wall biosynthesis